MPSKPATDGLLVIDKPVGITSRAVVDQVQGSFARGTRIGHTGTLDPLASGVLVLCIGKATRLTEYLQAMPKTYRTQIHVGADSATDDAEGPITQRENAPLPDFATITARLSEFIGAIEQIPPAFSAAKTGGQRAYKLARRGKEVPLAARTVRIHEINVMDYDYPALELEIRCGKGTYIRSLARDLGKRLGCGGYVQSLCRTRVGPFTLEDATPLTGAFQLLPMELAVSDLPRVTVDANDAQRLAQGQPVPFADAGVADRDVAVFTAASVLVAVARADRASGCLRPTKVFHIMTSD